MHVSAIMSNAGTKVAVHHCSNNIFSMIWSQSLKALYNCTLRRSCATQAPQPPSLIATTWFSRTWPRPTMRYGNLVHLQIVTWFIYEYVLSLGWLQFLRIVTWFICKYTCTRRSVVFKDEAQTGHLNVGSFACTCAQGKALYSRCLRTRYDRSLKRWFICKYVCARKSVVFQMRYDR